MVIAPGYGPPRGASTAAASVAWSTSPPPRPPVVTRSALPMSQPIDIGIPEDTRLEIADGLSHVLADTYTLYLKTHNYHWNVTGPLFNTLHLMFETQYNELWLAVDLIAERIRSLGSFAPGSGGQFARADGDRRGRRRAEGRGDDPRPRDRPRDGRAHGAARSSRSSSRPATSRPPTSSRSACRSTRRPPGCCARCWRTSRHGSVTASSIRAWRGDGRVLCNGCP